MPGAIDYLSMGRVTRVGCMCIALRTYACQRMRPTCGCALTRRRFETLRYNVAPANCSACSLFVSRPDGHESIRNHPRLRSPCYASSKILRVPIINLVSTSLTRPRYIGRIVITRSFVHYSFLARHFDAWNLKKKGKN